MKRLLLLLGVLAIALGWWFLRSRNNPRATIPTNLTNALEMLIALEEQEAAKYWKPELEAQKRGRAANDLWDELNRSDHKIQRLAELLADTEIRFPAFGEGRQSAHGVILFDPIAQQNQSGTEWKERFRTFEQEGWRLERCEFRFIGIAPDTFYVSGHLINERTSARAILEGNVQVRFDRAGAIREIDATKLQLRSRVGPAAFTEMFLAEVRPPAGSYFIDPLIIWDLDRDGRLEVILAAANIVFRRAQGGRWSAAPLLAEDPGLMFNAILGDFTGDGTVDFLSVKFEGAVLVEGTNDGRFPGSGTLAWNAEPRLRYAQAVTAGDVDRDGDLDLFIGQYKLPYDHGQMPFPYFDSNDGYPYFLLTNDGTGKFTDHTQTCGLSAKRGRRVYSTSLLDLDLDEDLDLILVSDFAGLDVFENRGDGTFTDATRKWFDQIEAFGMAQSVADFNADGWLDLLMIGMNSPTADRLASANLSRPYEVADTAMRDRTTFGNRLFFGQPDGSFRQNELGKQIARTGWSWGSAAGDIDSDGFSELYIANGHETLASVQEYEPEFWLHDIYIGKSQENRLAESYFRHKFARTRGRGHSYGGYERNRLFLNESGTNFVEVAHLFGVAMEQDSRNAAFQDLDGDEKLDLIVTTFEAHPEVRQTIRFFRNELPQSGSSVRVQLRDLARTGASGRIVGARMNAFAFTFASGESYRTQTPPTLQLGTGSVQKVSVIPTNLFRIVESTPHTPQLAQPSQP